MKTTRSIDFQCQVKTISEANQRENWRVKLLRKKEQRELMAVAMNNALKGRKVELPCKVKLIRIGPRALDSDNLAGSMKHVRDSIAAKLGVDDGDAAKVTWEYSQMPVRIREYGVKVSIQSV